MLGDRTLVVATIIVALIDPCRGAESIRSDGDRKQAPGVIVSFDGGTVSDNIASVLRIAWKSGVLETFDYSPTPSDILCKMVAASSLPPPCEPIVQVIADINNRPELIKGYLGGPLKLPKLALTQYRTLQTFNRQQPSELQKGASILNNWGNLNSKIFVPPPVGTDNPNRLTVEFDGYRLFFQTNGDEQSRGFASAIFALGSSRVSVEILKLREEPAKANSISFDVSDFKAPCTADKKFKPTALDYQRLSDYDYDALAIVQAQLSAAAPVSPKVRIVDVSLIDSPNLYPSYGSPHAPSTDCIWGEFKTALHHSTHLAGIIASHSEFGFKGLAPNAEIIPFLWAVPNAGGTLDAAENRKAGLMDLIIDNYSNTPLEIFLAAVNFDKWEFDLVGGKLQNPNARFARTLEKRISQYHPFFVVAAGQEEAEGTPPHGISPISADFPANLGDLQSILVVTSCTDCSSATPKLWEQANFSEGDRKIVHVAAPGGNKIPGWISADNVGETFGTSQAAAYVAGIAASMISYYPNQYIDGATVKARIQVTSRPIPPDNNGLPSPDNDKINAGIVDPILALLDPSKHWLKQSGAWRQAKIKAVSAGPFAYQDPNNKQYIDTTSIRRVYKMPRNRWAIYTDNALMNAEVPPGDVKRFGPLVSVANEKLVQLCDSNWLRLQDVDDFIVAKQGLHANVCP